MMGLIGQGCEHGDVLEVTGTNTPTQKTPSVCGQQRNVLPGACVCRKKKNDYCVCVCCTVFDATRCLHPVGVWGWFVSNWVCVGGFSVEGTPGPVPIPVAKLDCADGTAIVGLWESKTPPTHQKLNIYIMVCGVRQNPPRRREAHPTHILCPFSICVGVHSKG